MILQKIFPPIPPLKIHAEQVRLLYRQGVLIQSLGLVTAVLAMIVFMQVVEHLYLIIWFVAMVFVTMTRLLITREFERINPKDHAIERWKRLYLWGTFTSGVVWGSLGIFFDTAWPPVYQVVLFSIFTGVIAGAFNTNSSVPLAFPAFYIPVVFSAVVITAFQHDGAYIMLSGMFVIYMILMHFSSLTFYEHLLHSLENRFTNEMLATELSESNEKFAMLAQKDALTGLFNRRAMNSFLQNEWDRCEREEKPLSILFIDIDFFKQYNDTYGHTEGDRCLMEVGRILKKSAPMPKMMAARFGGEEFTVILPEYGLKESERVADEICGYLKEKKIEHKNSNISNQVTISIGISSVVSFERQDVSGLMKLADQALYSAKNSGRNCIVTI